MNIYRSTSYIL